MKTWALFVDAYRELNSKKLFWITMILSGLVVAIFAAVGLNERGLVLLWFTLPTEGFNSETFPPNLLYKFLFLNLGVRFWLTTIATVLALITTAGMIPDFISGGSIELMLSKPISRTRLYLTKFVCGLSFVTMQVTVFAVASIVVIGLRGGVWEPGILLAIPIVVLFYSYLFCLCMLIGLITRSTLAALLLTGVLWVGLTALHWTDGGLLNFKVLAQQKASQIDARVASLEEELQILQGTSVEPERPHDPGEGFFGRVADEFRDGARVSELSEEELARRIERTQSELSSLRDDQTTQAGRVRHLSLWHGAVLGVKTVLPKTGDTLALLDKHLISMDEMSEFVEEDSDQNSGNMAAEAQYRNRSLWWVVGTSLIFEAFILGIGAWIFSRRDF